MSTRNVWVSAHSELHEQNTGAYGPAHYVSSAFPFKPRLFTNITYSSLSIYLHESSFIFPLWFPFWIVFIIFYNYTYKGTPPNSWKMELKDNFIFLTNFRKPYVAL